MTTIQDRIIALEAELESLKTACASPTLPTMIDLPDRDYAVSEAPITVEQYRSFCTATDREFPDQPKPHNPQNPITNISWNDAKAYVEWLSETTGDTYRLPTEDEFEHFCGDHQEASSDIAVYAQSIITTVKTKKPNKYGLYDCLGLVWEWQESKYE